MPIGSELSSQLSSIQAMQTVTALCAVVIAGVGAYIAFQQFRLGKEKHKLDLFERRMGIFDEVDNMLGTLRYHGIDREELRRFRRVINKGAFLFGPEVERYLDTLEDCANVLSFRGVPDMEGNDNSYAEKKLTESEGYRKRADEADAWLEANYEVHLRLFRPYLRFEALHDNAIENLLRSVGSFVGRNRT